MIWRGRSDLDQSEPLHLERIKAAASISTWVATAALAAGRRAAASQLRAMEGPHPENALAEAGLELHAQEGAAGAPHPTGPAVGCQLAAHPAAVGRASAAGLAVHLTTQRVVGPVPLGVVAVSAQAMPARLAWSPDPAWAAQSSGGSVMMAVTHQQRGAEHVRKRARQGRAKKAARKALPTDAGGAAGPAAAGTARAPEALGHPLAGDVWWQRPSSRESVDHEPFSDCSDMEDYTDDDWADSEVEEDIEEQLEGSLELSGATMAHRHQPRSIMDQSLSDLQDAPPVFPTPRRPDAVDLERHRSLTDSIESLIHKSEQKDIINSAAKEVFDRFNRGEDGRISQMEFCTLVQNFGVGMDATAPRLWELCAPTLCGPPGRPAGTVTASAPTIATPTNGWGSSRLSLREFQSFYRKWLSTPELRAKLVRKLRRASVGDNVAAAATAATAAAERRSRLRTPGGGMTTAGDTDDEGLEASIDEMIELVSTQAIPTTYYPTGTL